MIKVLVAGDLCPLNRVTSLFAKSAFENVFGEVKSYTTNVDYSIVNLEAPIVVGEAQPISKCGPNLKTDENIIAALKYSGFQCATLANNHFRDFGDMGCTTTVNLLQQNNLDFVGGGENINQAQSVLYKQINGEKLAIINFCENEFSIATKSRGGSAPLDCVDNYKQIVEARKKADYVLAIVHGGHEHYQYPSPRMKKLYRFFIDIGVDAVINHHQHCYSGYEVYKGKPIFYGLGNFCFDRGMTQYGNTWNEGFCVELAFNKQELFPFRIYPYIQCREYPSVKFMTGEKLDQFYKSIGEINNIISNDDLLGKEFDKFSDQRANGIYSLFFSYHNRYLNAAAIRNIIPIPCSTKELSVLVNYISCEAHRDITIKILTKLLDNNCKR